MSSRSTVFQWLLASWLMAMWADSGFAQISAACGMGPPVAAGALLEPTSVTPTGNVANDKLIHDAEAAFAAKNYDVSVLKLQELLAALGDAGQTERYAVIYYKVGLAQLLGDKIKEAEAAFIDCIKRFPKGEYTSRSYLGLGRACMREDPLMNCARAAAALKNAAQDAQCRPQAMLWLGEVYQNFGQNKEALAVYRELIGREVRTFQQVVAAAAVLGILVEQGMPGELTSQFEQYYRQPGVQDSIVWLANEMVIRGDSLMAGCDEQYALVFYRFVPLRAELLEIQRASLAKMRRRLATLESRVKAEAYMPISRRSLATQFVANLKSTIVQSETMYKAIEEKTDLDAMLLMRRGRCFLRLNRYEEALVCFRTIRMQYPDAPDAKKAALAEVVTFGEMFTHPNLGNRCAIKLFNDEFIWQRWVIE